MHVVNPRLWPNMDKKNVDTILETLNLTKVNRRDLLKLTGAGLAAASVGGLLAACGDGDTATPTAATAATGAVVTVPKGGSFGQIILVANDYTSIMGTTGRATAKILGAEYTEANAQLDPLENLSAAESMMAAGANYISYASLDGSEVRPIAEAAEQNQVPVTNLWSTLPWYTPYDANEYYSWFIGLFEVDNHYRTVKALFEQLQEGNIFHLQGFPGASTAIQRNSAVERALAEHPNITVVAEETGEWDPVLSQRVTEDMIAREGTPAALVADNDAMLQGALAAFEGLGIEPGVDVLLSGEDGDAIITDAIKEGKVFSTGFHGDGFWFGMAPMVRMFDVFNGVEFKTAERHMGQSGGFPITADNVEGFSARYFDNPDRLPFDPILMSRAHTPDDWDPQALVRAWPIDDFYRDTGAGDRPADYTYAPEYQAALDAGEFEQVTQEWADHNKLKLDDFTYTGVEIPA